MTVIGSAVRLLGYFLWPWRNKEEHINAFKRVFDPGAHVCRKVHEYVEDISVFNIVM